MEVHHSVTALGLAQSGGGYSVIYFGFGDYAGASQEEYVCTVN